MGTLAIMLLVTGCLGATADPNNERLPILQPRFSGTLSLRISQNAFATSILALGLHILDSFFWHCLMRSCNRFLFVDSALYHAIFARCSETHTCVQTESRSNLQGAL